MKELFVPLVFCLLQYITLSSASDACYGCTLEFDSKMVRNFSANEVDVVDAAYLAPDNKTSLVLRTDFPNDSINPCKFGIRYSAKGLIYVNFGVHPRRTTHNWSIEYNPKRHISKARGNGFEKKATIQPGVKNHIFNDTDTVVVVTENNFAAPDGSLVEEIWISEIGQCKYKFQLRKDVGFWALVPDDFPTDGACGQLQTIAPLSTTTEIAF